MTAKGRVAALVLISISMLLSGRAHAVIPRQEIENLRRMTIVVRVALDQPAGRLVKSCKSKDNLAGVGEALALRMDGAESKWKKLRLLAADLPELRKAVAQCEKQGSCTVYRSFLGAVSTDASIQSEILTWVQTLDQTIGALTSASYAEAWSTVPLACRILRKLARS